MEHWSSEIVKNIAWDIYIEIDIYHLFIDLCIIFSVKTYSMFFHV